MTTFNTKRVYEIANADDGIRILVDRLWPRGLSKEKLDIDYWAKDVAPSHELRKWYQHDHDKWLEFKQRYFEELNNNDIAVNALKDQIKALNVTFLYASKEQVFNNAHALIEYLEISGK